MGKAFKGLGIGAKIYERFFRFILLTNDGDGADFSLMHLKLLKWYQKEGRKSLPWRDKESPNRPYRVLVSEVMLQQTQVKTVLDRYYFPFLESFPTLEVLAHAREEEVLLLWRGMGYYQRARNLLECAKICKETFNGQLPNSIAVLKRLPGIGVYTAGAVACFGFDEIVSFVDSNIKRVLIRFFGLHVYTQSILEAKANSFLNHKDAFNHNQALLDLGALVCTPVNPKCSRCPIGEFCKGKENLESFMIKKASKSIQKNLYLGIFQKDSQIALHKSQEKLYYNLYNFPLLASYQCLQKLGEIKHSYTKYQLTLHLYLVDDLTYFAQPVELLHKECLDEIPISSMTLKILKFLEKYL